jgi:hypothetical protein
MAACDPVKLFEWDSQSRHEGIRVILPQNDSLTVTSSTFVKGEMGLIAKRAFKKGDALFRVEGPVMDRPTKYSFALRLDKHIEPQREDGISDFGHYMNHSCDPNVIVRPVIPASDAPYIEVVARRPVAAGEEIAFDYASLEYEVTVANATCRCGKALCRGVIHGFKDLPDAVAEDYAREGLIPDYLLDMRSAEPLRRVVNG